MSVQAGFVAGSVGLVLFNLADRIPTRLLFTISALIAAVATASIAAFATGLWLALVLRFITGLSMVGVYPVGMRITATWTKSDRGLGIGLLTGAIAVGTASPHLLNILISGHDWRILLYLAAGLAVVGGIVAWFFIKEGPYAIPTAPFNWKYALEIARIRELRLANLGYLGHMWELFAMWTWVGVFLLASFQESGLKPFWAGLATFATVAAGGPGSLLAGKFADRLGRTTITIAALTISGACSLFVGFLFGANPLMLTAICLVWGFTVAANSAQFSAAISELCQREYMGTALTLQTCLGFMLTLITIRLIPTLQGWLGWQWAFVILVLGPIVGVWSMGSLHRMPEIEEAGRRKKVIIQI